LPELFSYKITSDTGFAPNPFFGILSLATCKPWIRELRKPGSYIAGFTSKALCNDKVGEERLVFIMKVTAKLTYNSYFIDEKFQIKKPSHKSRITLCGDNIYYELNSEYHQALSYFHKKNEDIIHDLISDKVLLSSEFFYFGSGAIPIDRFKVKIPRTQTPYGVKTSNTYELEKLWHYLKANFKNNCLLAPPHNWVKDEPYNM